ncbi:unnamed protein product [Mycena citricolor]|uniref:Uncharacterized protein n=1 Tax=Mycena citricolor TaxID=2018698 RepID=A0AAD2HTA4_9AGAR|nr:unnamed protein product [Mycena citricolor]
MANRASEISSNYILAGSCRQDHGEMQEKAGRGDPHLTHCKPCLTSLQKRYSSEPSTQPRRQQPGLRFSEDAGPKSKRSFRPHRHGLRVSRECHHWTLLRRTRWPPYPILRHRPCLEKHCLHPPSWEHLRDCSIASSIAPTVSELCQ